MTTQKRTLLGALIIGGIGAVACAIVGPAKSHALAPCRSFQVVRLTGTLVEVRQGDTVLDNEQAIVGGLPRSVCVSPTDTNRQTATVTVADCEFRGSVNATLTP